MIISKTPYRIPISGGGTDIDFYINSFFFPFHCLYQQDSFEGFIVNQFSPIIAIMKS